MRANTIESFQDKYIPEPNSGCWLWEEGENSKGYGRTCIKGKKDFAYRIMYELYRGPIPQGMTLDHLCRVRCCVNPDHLEIVSNKENVLRGFGVTAMNARKTHCINGHPLSGGNLCKLKYGRSCKTCARIRARKYAERKRKAGR